MHFGEGIDYKFPSGVWLQPGAYLVLANHARFFEDYYGYAPFAQYDKDLSNQGERIVLLDAFGTPVLDVTYSDDGAWPQAADGGTGGRWRRSQQPLAWRESTATGGSPGAADPAPVVINEVEVSPLTAAITKVELFNPSQDTADVGGWQSRRRRRRLFADRALRSPFRQVRRLPLGPSVPPGGYAVVDVTSSNLVLGNVGDSLTLLSAMPSGRLRGYAHSADLPLPLDRQTSAWAPGYQRRRGPFCRGGCADGVDPMPVHSPRRW